MTEKNYLDVGCPHNPMRAISTHFWMELLSSHSFLSFIFQYDKFPKMWWLPYNISGRLHLAVVDFWHGSIWTVFKIGVLGSEIKH